MLKFTFRNIMAATLIAGAATLGVLSCTKKVDTANYAKFLGDWKITDNCSGFNISHIDIAASSNSYDVNVTYKMGWLNPTFGANYDSCQREVTIKGVVNSNAAKDYFSIGNQVVTDNCGNVYTISGGAYIKPAIDQSRDTLMITIVTTTTGGSSACSYKGLL
ncbi:hypothetical protein [Flavipsychrobacter stenotrophus]|nr:hypothetical protein [Flavipsychrobacter stenotrophus]